PVHAQPWWPLPLAVERVPPPAPQPGRHGRLLPPEDDAEGPVLRNDGHDRLTGHVAATDEDVGVVEAGGVEELLPAHLGAMEIGGEKDLGHPSTSTLRISRSKPVTCLRMIASARSPSPARIA